MQRAAARSARCSAPRALCCASSAPRAASAPLQPRRREALCGVALWLATAGAARAAEPAALDAAFADAFAAAAAGDAAAADAAWSRAVAASPADASAALANRGTARLQAGRWADARDDLAAAAALDERAGRPDPLTLNNLGNALGATGDWPAALQAFDAASRIAPPQLAPIPRANAALALFESGYDAEALRAARALLRRDSEFWDMRAFAAAALWAAGREAEAEAEWATLCSSGRGFGARESAERPGEEDPSGLSYSARLFAQQAAQIGGVISGRVRDSGDATPCRLYGSTARVAGRWPPRATAALDAFLRVSRRGEARGYDGAARTFDFATASK